MIKKRSNSQIQIESPIIEEDNTETVKTRDSPSDDYFPLTQKVYYQTIYAAQQQQVNSEMLDLKEGYNIFIDGYCREYAANPEFLIGEGFFGAVYIVQDVDQKHQVIEKRLPLTRFEHLSEDEQHTLIEDLFNEFDLLKSMNHKNLVPYLGTTINDETLDIHQGFVNYPTLLTVLRDENLANEDQLLSKLTQEILHGLEFLHQKGVIHGNLKAANVFVKDDSSCLLTDYGHAKRIYLNSKARIFYDD